MSHLSITCFGSLELQLDGNLLSGFRSQKVRALLAYLLLESDLLHERTHLSGLLWPDYAEEQAKTYLRHSIANLRKVIYDKAQKVAFLEITPSTIRFNRASDYWFDVDILCAKLAGLKLQSTSFTTEEIQQFQQAIALYRAPLLNGFFMNDCAEFEQWLLLKREHLHYRVINTLYTIATYYEQRKMYEQAHQYAWRLVELEPSLEEVHRQLMRLLAITGQRTAALTQFEKCRILLQQEMNVEPADETVALFHAISDGTFASSVNDAEATIPVELKTAHNAVLSHPSPLIGREQAIAQVSALLRQIDCRLVTLIGPGGIGKTSLSLQIANVLHTSFPHGIHFVPLSAVESSKEIALAILEALQVPGHSMTDGMNNLLYYLQDKKLILILDNFEHLLSNVDPILMLLDHAPNIKLMVTSRERLNIKEERLFVVDGLTVPDHEEVARLNRLFDEGELNRFSSLQLFSERAQRVQPNFALSAKNITDVVRICQLVAGIPLGIELAAGWLRVLPCYQIGEEIHKNISFLASPLRDMPERHRSMDAVLTQSWQLLTAAEQATLKRLAIFQGGFRRDAAEQVTGVRLHMLLSFVDKSLLQVNASGRFQYHELLRQFASKNFELEAAESNAIQQRHALYFVQFLLERIDFPKGNAQQEDLEHISQEMANIRAAWPVIVRSSDGDILKRIVDILWYFADFRGWLLDVHDLLTDANQLLRARIIAQYSSSQEDPNSDKLLLVLGRLLHARGWIEIRLGEVDEVAAALADHCTFVESVNRDPFANPWVVLLSAWIHHKRGAQNEAINDIHLSIPLFEKLDDLWGRGLAFHFLGTVYYILGQFAEAKRYLEQSINDWKRYQAHPGPIAFCLHSLINIARVQGQYTLAKQLAEECKSILEHLGYAVGLAYVYSNLGHIFRAESQWDQAAMYYQQSLDISYRINLRDIIEVSYYGLGCSLLEQNELAEARRQFMQSLDFAESQGTLGTRGTAAVYNGLASVALAEQKYVEAETNSHKALDIALTNDAKALAIDVLLNFSQLAKAQNQLFTAFSLLCFIKKCAHSKYISKQHATKLLSEWSNNQTYHLDLIIECDSEIKDLTISEVLKRYIPPTI